VELYVDRARLPAAAEGEFYHADLIGLAALDAEGNTTRQRRRRTDYGAGDLLEIRLAGSSKTELVPFRDVFVPEVDLAARRLVVALPSASEDDAERRGGPGAPKRSRPRR